MNQPNDIRRIAIFGGAFNPPTIAHAGIIHSILDFGDFDRVWVMPSRSRSDKTIETDDEDRLALIDVFLRDNFANEGVELSRIEIDQQGLSQTHQTMKALSKMYPELEFHYVIGEDSLATLPSWENGAWLLANVRWVVVPRAPHGPIQLLPRYVRYIPAPPQQMSSTEVRHRVVEGMGIEAYVSRGVEDLIKQRRLYQ